MYEAHYRRDKENEVHLSPSYILMEHKKQKTYLVYRVHDDYIQCDGSLWLDIWHPSIFAKEDYVLNYDILLEFTTDMTPHEYIEENAPEYLI